MRVTVSMMKGSSWRMLPDAPHEGTAIRSIYDFLMGHKAENVSLPTTLSDDSGRHQSLIILRDIYGLDIRRVGFTGNRGGGRGRAIYCLVGRDDGDKYVDFLAEKYAT